MPERPQQRFRLFRLSLFPANPELVRLWRIRSGISAAASAGSVGAVAAGLRHAFGPKMLDEQFIYMALAISFITGGTLVGVPACALRFSGGARICYESLVSSVFATWRFPSRLSSNPHGGYNQCCHCF